MTYDNPVIPGFHPDPSVCRVGEDYYLVTSSFEYFPGVPIFHSRNLVNWNPIGHCLTRRSQLDLGGAKSSGGIYAPTIRYHEGKFYMVTTDTTGIGNFYVYTDDPTGKWSEPVAVKQGGIDPSLYFDPNGRVYFTSNCLHGTGHGIQQSEIDLQTGRLLRDPVFIWAGTGGKFPEAPHLYKKDDWYYLLVSEGGTEFGHMITGARSKEAFGPFEACPANPILSHRSTSASIQATGHGDLVQDHLGDWWMVFLGVRHVPYPLVHHVGRETFLAPVTWSLEGWPVVNDGAIVEAKMEVRSGLTCADQSHPPIRTDFDNAELELYWNFRRNPVEHAWSLTKRRGWLALACLPASLDDVAPVAFIGRRQQHFACNASTLIEFSPLMDDEEAGLTAIMNENYRNDLFITSRDGYRVVILRRRVGSLTAEIAVERIAPKPAELWLKADRDWYEFGYTLPEGRPISLGRAETRHLSTEIAGGFTGVYLGLFATSNHRQSETWAFFDWFDYRPEHITGDEPIILKSVTSKPKL